MFGWGVLIGGLVTLVTLAGRALGIVSAVIPIHQVPRSIDGTWTLNLGRISKECWLGSRFGEARGSGPVTLTGSFHGSVKSEARPGG